MLSLPAVYLFQPPRMGVPPPHVRGPPPLDIRAPPPMRPEWERPPGPGQLFAIVIVILLTLALKGGKQNSFIYSALKHFSLSANHFMPFISLEDIYFCYYLKIDWMQELCRSA